MSSAFTQLPAFPSAGVFILLGALILGALLLLASDALGGKTALPSAAKVIASDTGQRRVKRYESKRLKLRGQPDFIIEERVGFLRRRKLVPVEVKSWSSRKLYPAQEIQLAVYLALMKEEHGDSAVADYGYVVYRGNGQLFRVEWTPALIQDLDQSIVEARKIKRARAAIRSHESRAQCATCPFAKVCSDSLVRGSAK